MRVSNTKEIEMFDTRKIGARIAELRKAKDMTQMELADLMFVSFQAVSNWERGNSMPDIGKLGDLARILGVSIEELLGSEEQSRIVNKVVNKDPEIKLEELIEVAPMLKPSQLEKAVENNQEEHVSMGVLAALAPFLSSARLAKEMEKAKIEDISEIVPLAPFLDEGYLGAFIDKQDSAKKSLKALGALAPFLDSKHLGAYAREAMDGEDFEQLTRLAPFLDEKDLAEAALKIFDSGKHAGKLASLAPFLSSETIGKLAAKIDPEEQKNYLIALAPFMDSKDLTEIAKVQIQKGNMKLLRALMPFIDKDGLI
jgi:transcriptional regulator with XRE-family HTH domain